MHDVFLSSQSIKEKRMDKFPKIVIATDKFKGTLNASEAADAIKNGILKRGLDSRCDIENLKRNITTFAMADGGEGSLKVMEKGLKLSGKETHIEYIDALNHIGEQIKVPILLYNDSKSAFIEMATICGLSLVPKERRNLLRSTTYGFGDTLRYVIEDMGIRDITIAIGGSGTNDAGFGALTALGFRYHNNCVFKNRDFAEFMENITAIEDKFVSGVTPHLKETKIKVACDVNNPLLGENGATMVYGPQKGGTPEELQRIENSLKIWAKAIEDKYGEGSANFPGAGAAGGIGFILHTVLGAEMRPGWELFAEMLGLEEAISSADYVFTGEGKFDRQSLAGKLPVGIARICSKYNKPLFLVTGKIDNVTKEEIKVIGVSDFIELNNNPHDKSPFSYAREIIVEEVSKLMKNKGIL